MIRDRARGPDSSRDVQGGRAPALEAAGGARNLSPGVAPTLSPKERFERFGTDFGMETHTSLQMPLESLSRHQLTVVHRVCMEASWNAAKHSGAENLWLESYLAEDVFMLVLRDDGRGFRAGRSPEGWAFAPCARGPRRSAARSMSSRRRERGRQ